MGTKPKWMVLSTTILGSALAMAAGVWNLSVEDVSQLDGVIQGMMTVVGAALAVYGRFTAKSKITVLPPTS